MLVRLARRTFVCAVIVCACPALLLTPAENIDPAGDDSRYAWAENAGWINAEPSGDGGPGVQVDDFELTGWMWGENTGWINISCRNTSSCDAVDFHVVNDGAGALSGYAWAENAGWINFAPSTAGVTVDVVTGDFSGRAWGENIGWITFASTGPHPYKVKTGWNCSPPPSPPSGSPDLLVDKSGPDALLSWTTVPGATGYDVVYGEVDCLRSTGSLIGCTLGCPGENRTSGSLAVAGMPLPGGGFWFLVRGTNCGGCGSYGTTRRDSDIAASGMDCLIP